MIIAWDFDGVLNQNQSDGRYVWEDAFEREVGQPVSAFATFVFGTAPSVISGEADILQRLQHWVQVAECRMGAAEILAFWLAQDARPDAEMLALVDDLNRTGQRQIIATNNEARRAAYIGDQMGMSARVERIFASGPMRVAKPDPDYYRHITDALGVAPSDMFFVDDLKANVDAAIRAGWQGFHFTLETRADLITKLRP